MGEGSALGKIPWSPARLHHVCIQGREQEASQTGFALTDVWTWPGAGELGFLGEICLALSLSPATCWLHNLRQVTYPTMPWVPPVKMENNSAHLSGLKKQVHGKCLGHTKLFFINFAKPVFLFIKLGLKWYLLMVRQLLHGRKAIRNLDSILKSRDIILLTEVAIVKAMIFPVVMYRCESWTIKKAECWRIDVFKLWCWGRFLRVFWTARRSNQSVNPKGKQPWIFIGRTDTEALILWPPDAKSRLIRKDPDAGKDCGQEEKGKTEDEMIGWHHRLNGHEFEQTLEDSEGQGSLGCWRSVGWQRVWHNSVSEQQQDGQTVRIKYKKKHLKLWAKWLVYCKGSLWITT